MGELKTSELGLDRDSLRRSVADSLLYAVGKDPVHASQRDWYRALATAIRRRITARRVATDARYEAADQKRVYYLSLEFLIGRSLSNALINLDIVEPVRSVLLELGYKLEEVEQLEADAGLGNGGLGRLAACYLDSMATLKLPGFGYGIRYDYGIFTQLIGAEGEQIERANRWLHYQNYWETRVEDLQYTIRFGGRVQATGKDGAQRREWVETEDIVALAYDTPIPGNDGETVNHLRLWAGRAVQPFDLRQFNAGNYPAAVSDQIKAKNLSRVLYPDDSTPQGRELRLAQQYFFVSASLQDILAGFLRQHDDLRALPDKVAVQLNDTHPALAIPELMRLLMDDHGLDWNDAWGITVEVFAYTNHTLLPEALEQWPVRMFEALLPRHLSIIYQINRRLLDAVSTRFPGETDRIRRMSLISDDGDRQIRMAYLAIVGSHKVNGVAELHSRLMRETIFTDFATMYPERFTNVTNGVTPRRWLKEANPALAALITRHIGPAWQNDLSQLSALARLAEDAEFRAAFAAVKHANKERLAALIKKRTGIEVNAESMFDVHVKRFHEYKRQLLNLLYVVVRYNRLRKNPDSAMVARTVIFSGKAAPGYVMAKTIIQLINRVAAKINADPKTSDRLKLVFIPDYNVSLAQIIIPAADLSQQISTAGMEASGTGNMKLALNGALTIGTLDGANIEMLAEIGADNLFIFGLTAEEVAAQRAAGYDPEEVLRGNAELAEAIDMIRTGYFSPKNRDEFAGLVDRLVNPGEHFLVLADFDAYSAAQARVDNLHGDAHAWNRKAVLNTAGMGKFSSDRSIREYAERIWNITPVPR